MVDEGLRQGKGANETGGASRDGVLHKPTEVQSLAVENAECVEVRVSQAHGVCKDEPCDGARGWGFGRMLCKPTLTQVKWLVAAARGPEARPRTRI